MTEQEWLACPLPRVMLTFLGRRASSRKLRLFCVACCRRLFDRVEVYQEDRNGVEVAERFADGKASTEELRAVQGFTSTEWTTATVYEGGGTVEAAEDCAWQAMVSAPDQNAYPPDTDENVRAYLSAGEAWERPAQVRLLRCLFGNPFRPTRIDPTWLAGSDCAVVRLAQAISDERAFDRLPILADALEEAGCSDAELLAHCRRPGEHARGCWVIDLLLGKT
jgi:hypothetical protein